MAKAEWPNVNNGHDTRQNKAVNLPGSMMTSANIVVKGAGSIVTQFSTNGPGLILTLMEIRSVIEGS